MGAFVWGTSVCTRVEGTYGENDGPGGNQGALVLGGPNVADGDEGETDGHVVGAEDEPGGQTLQVVSPLDS